MNTHAKAPPKLTCQVCANEGRAVRAVERAELREGVAAWIHNLCPSCVARLKARAPREATA
jgi:hypothetical protein